MAKKYDTPPEWATHGLITTYRSYGCRCNECSETNRAVKRRSYARNRDRVLAQQKALRNAKPKRPRPSVIDRFWQRVDKRGSNECWLWTGADFGSGEKKGRWYGVIWVDGRQMTSHRLSAMIHFGMFDRRAFICHTCDVPRCVNPNHLYVGDPLTNARDRETRGRGYSRSNGHHATRLTESQVDEICDRYVPAVGGQGGNARALADEYGVSIGYISELARKRRKEMAHGNS